jgi:putative ABC transport system substrate-binding protein
MASSHAADGRPLLGLAAKATTSSIPIVFNAGEDPVTLSLVSSINRPGGNATGVYVFLVEMDAKRMELVEGATSAKSIAHLNE